MSDDTQLGATGQFPDGKINAADEGEIKLAIGHKDGQVFIEFGTPVKWLASPPAAARHMAALLLKHAEACEEDDR